MRSLSRHSACAVGICALSCGDPELATDLDTEGPPEVTIVTVLSESLGEAATFCLSGSEYKVNRDLCPPDENGGRAATPVLDAQPVGWSTRIAFSELLDPNVETLVPVEDEEGNVTGQRGSLASTQPVILTCDGAPVAYDGYYDPSGNDVTLPPGPALVIEPLEFIATGTPCTVTLKPLVVDKDGNAVPEAMRGPYSFSIASLAVLETLPADEETEVDPLATLMVLFNAPIDMESLAGTISLTSGGAEVPVTLSVSADDPTTVLVDPESGALEPNTEYVLTINGNGIRDEGGSELNLEEAVVITFTTGELVPPDGGLPEDAAVLDGGPDGGPDGGVAADAALPLLDAALPQLDAAI